MQALAAHRGREVLVLGHHQREASLLELLDGGGHPLAALVLEGDAREILEHVGVPSVVVLHLLLGAHVTLDAWVDGLINPGTLPSCNWVEEVRLAKLLAFLIHIPLVGEGIAK